MVHVDCSGGWGHWRRCLRRGPPHGDADEQQGRHRVRSTGSLAQAFLRRCAQCTGRSRRDVLDFGSRRDVLDFGVCSILVDEDCRSIVWVILVNAADCRSIVWVVCFCGPGTGRQHRVAPMRWREGLEQLDLLLCTLSAQQQS